MDAKLKELWLAALRSGEYPQTMYTLKNSQGYCCLGVLCHVAAEANLLPATLVVQEEPGQIVVKETREGFEEESNDQLPDGAFGIATLFMHRLMACNDGRFIYRQHSFEEIADLIEKEA